MKTGNVHIVECLTHSNIGGGQTVVHGIAALWKKYYPHERMSIVLPAHGIYGDRFRKLGVDVYELPFDRLSMVTLVRTFILLRRIKPTVIHSHGKGAGFYMRIVPGWYVSARKFHTYHGFHIPRITAAALLYRYLESFLLRATDMVIAISKCEANEVKRIFWRSGISCTVIENVVDCLALQESSNDNSIPSIESFFLSHDKRFIVTMIARHDPVKNYPLALDACRITLQKREECAFLFVGIDTENIEFKRVKQEFPQSVCGVEAQPSIAAIISKSNAILLTSRKEGMPLVIQEAFCLSKPVIATNVAGTNELVIDGSNGLLCDEKPDAVAAAIMTLIDNKDYYQKLCSGAAKTATKYDIEEFVSKYHAVYSSS